MRKLFAIPALALGVGLLGCDGGTTALPASTPPSLITRGGELAGEAHPEVVLIIMDVAGVPTYSCSGTLISPTVVLTAGHCVGEPGDFSGIRIFTESDVQNGDNNFPFAGPNSIEATSWAAHPEYTNEAFYLHDVGVIVLSEPVNLPDEQYGTLPTVNQLNSLPPRKSSMFTTVGYGTQLINPVKYEGDFVRMIAYPHLIQQNGPLTGPFSIMLSNNASSGGTCYGDSGGPNYIGTSNVIGGVTSYGRTDNCVGYGGVFRLDRPDVLAFINQYLD